MTTLASAIDGVVQRFEAKANAARQLQAILRDYPELLEELLALKQTTREPVDGLGNAAPLKRGSRMGKHGRATAFQKIASVFIDNNNQWIDTGEVARLSDIQR